MPVFCAGYTTVSSDLTSPAFEDGAPIPERYRGRLLGANVSPPLVWTQPPAGTAELVLIVQDPDVPFGQWITVQQRDQQLRLPDAEPQLRH